MQRDWEVIRQILLRLEQLGDTRSRLMADEVPPYDPDSVSYHMRMLGEAGLIETKCSESTAGLSCFASCLTWSGHEFLDQLRDHTVWNRIKATAREKGAALSFEVIKTLATTIIAALLKP